VVYGDGCAANIGEHVVAHGRQRPLVISDPGIVAAGLLEPVRASLAAAGLAYETYTDVEPDPRVAVVAAGLRQFQEQGCDSLIGVGGGSSMDTAKAIAIWSRNPGRLRDYEGLDQFEQPPVPLFCAPTTVGTASEVTQFLVVTDPEAQFKFTIAGRMVPPLAAFLDPQLVLGLPAPITAATGMDALTHAIESYLSLLATPLTEALALHAIRLIGANLRPAVANSRNHGAMANMLVASCLAGMAFNATRLGNVHAMSHPVGAFFHVPHGVANAIILPHVMEFNALAVPRKLIEVGQALGEQMAGLGEMAAARRAVTGVQQLEADIGIPPCLSDVGVQREAIAAMAVDAMKSGNIPINPRRTVQSDIEGLFEQAL
jgi:alcohol dehydrogenase class IV